MEIVGFNRERFHVSEKPAPKRKRKRELVHCKCSDWYEAGTYDVHIRHSTHDSHDKDRGFRVDVKGNVSPL